MVSLIDIGPTGRLIQDMGIPLYSLGMRRTIPSVRAVRKLWRFLRRERPDILWTWLYHADLLGSVVGKAAGVPVLVWNVRCSDLQLHHYPWLTGVVFHLIARLSGLPDAVVVNSHAGRMAHLRAGYRPRRLEVIPNGFDLEHFCPDASARQRLITKLGLPEGAVIIGLVARYDPMKDHEMFLAAARDVVVRHREARFVLCGEGVSSDNAALMCRVRHYELTDAVHLLGLRQDIPDITAAFDIACSSSQFGEGFSNTIGEAMACGVPCVVTNVGDAAAIVGTTGRVVAPADGVAFAKALNELIECGEEGRRSLGRRARARIVEHFDMHVIADRYRELCQSLVLTSHKRSRYAWSAAGDSNPTTAGQNLDRDVVRGFGDEWTRFDQSDVADQELRTMFEQYFRIFPWAALPQSAVGFDLGCGSGRWARFVAPRVGSLHCIDPSAAALAVAQRSLRPHPNCLFHLASVDNMPLADNSMDFGYALGVMHHLPDTDAGIQSCARKLKPGAPLLLYLYYALDNRPLWFRLTWRLTNVFRYGISRLPFTLRYAVSQCIAAVVYYPLARLGRLLERLGSKHVAAVPLSYYRRRSFYTMRTDALDRFGTRVEKRFSATEIIRMLETAGLERISFSNTMPYWCVIGYKK